MPRKWLFEDEAGAAAIVADDLDKLRKSGMKPTQGDTRCITFGHLTRMAIWDLRGNWDSGESTRDKIQRFATAIHALGEPERILKTVDALAKKSQSGMAVHTPPSLSHQEMLVPGTMAPNIHQRSTHAVPV
uniref:Uncharacterized protein n=1 Tax=Candidatus Kentrum sp. FW TaxID=2126338 RepID=A0A450TN50_9GAMM|nr:MAG: hypothetical protein BECKFW1821B_GA0114236_11614 [Candidatus Kentron sp. FW]